MAELPTAQLERPASESARADWQRARFRVLMPLGLVVASAIVCIVVAALTSARRADDVALERERELLARAITTHGEWSLGRLRTLIGSNSSVSVGDIEQSPALVQQRIANWLGPLNDHNLVLILNSDNDIAYSQSGTDATPVTLNSNALGQLRSIASHLRSSRVSTPAGIVALSNTTDGGAFLFDIDDRFAISAAAAVRSLGVNTGAPEATPIAMAIRLIGPETLAGIADQLQLANLRMLHEGGTPAGYNEYEFLDQTKQPIARFVWLPQKPGAEILGFVFPFIGVALVGFIILAALVSRYMRHTSATIEAGESRLRYLALHDPLCGLPNRNSFSERLERVIAEVKRGGQPAAVFFIDLDHFKDVNDTLGHPVGDELIRYVTMRLSRIMREDDLVARLGGDEFAVITSASSDHSELQDIAARMIAKLSAPYSISGHTIVIGASIGIALVDGRSATAAADILRYADMALYRAKNGGRNRACIYDAVMDADMSQRKLIEQELRECIENGRMKVAYQPIFNASGEKIVAVEALARWPSSARGPMSPEDFIPIAEHSGLINPLGECILRQACLDGLEWPYVSVSVNVSPLQFRRADFVSTVERILAETGFEPARLELEITESTLLGNLDNAEDAMRRLKALGVRLALDDFGTGYSSLLYLRRFPFDNLKIDKSFVLSLEKTSDAAAIVHAVVSLGRGLGMKVTAEGVETAEQHLFLRAAGVHCMQGFRFGKPMEPAEVAAQIATPGIYRTIEGDAHAALAG